MRKNTSGFTLVELLIVIVVIAILAAISVVAYNGIQDRARDASILNDLSQIAKQFELYNAQEGSYPATATEAAALGARFSFSPTGNNVLLCSDDSGYAILARQPSANTRQFAVSTGRSPQRLTVNVWGSATPMCQTTGYPVTSWGSYWVQGG